MSRRAIIVFGWVALAIGIVACGFALTTGLFFTSSAATTLTVMSVIVAGTSLTLSAIAFLTHSRDGNKRVIVASGSGSVAAGGDVTGNTIGGGSRAAHIPATENRNTNPNLSQASSVSATGLDAIAAGGNVEDNVIDRKNEE